MLVSLNRKHVKESESHSDVWTKIKLRLTEDQINEVKTYLNNYVDELMNDPNRAKAVEVAWIIGNSNPWPEPFETNVYMIAAEQNFDVAGSMAGLFLWRVMGERPETWVFIKDESKQRPCMCYFLDNGN